MISVTNVRLDMDGFDLINLEGLALNGRLREKFPLHWVVG